MLWACAGYRFKSKHLDVVVPVYFSIGSEVDGNYRSVLDQSLEWEPWVGKLLLMLLDLTPS